MNALSKLLLCANSDLLHQTVRLLQFEPEKAEQALKRLLGTCRPPTMSVSGPELLFKEAAQRIEDGNIDEGTVAFKRLLTGPWDYYNFVCRALGYYKIEVSPDYLQAYNRFYTARTHTYHPVAAPER